MLREQSLIVHDQHEQFVPSMISTAVHDQHGRP